MGPAAAALFFNVPLSVALIAGGLIAAFPLLCLLNNSRSRGQADSQGIGALFALRGSVLAGIITSTYLGFGTWSLIKQFVYTLRIAIIAEIAAGYIGAV